MCIYLLCELLPQSMVKSSIAVHDLRRSLFKPIVCCVGQMPLLVAAVRSGSDGHDENRRDALSFCVFNFIDEWKWAERKGKSANFARLKYSWLVHTYIILVCTIQRSNSLIWRVLRLALLTAGLMRPEAIYKCGWWWWWWWWWLWCDKDEAFFIWTTLSRIFCRWFSVSSTIYVCVRVWQRHAHMVRKDTSGRKRKRGIF